MSDQQRPHDFPTVQAVVGVPYGPELVLPLVRVTEAIDGDASHDEKYSAVSDELRARFGGDDRYVWVRELTDDQVVYEIEPEDGETSCYKLGYTFADGDATLTGDPIKVERKVTYDVVEARTQLGGRVIEAAGTSNATGGRVFRTRILRYGESRNGRVYPAGVMAAAAPLYEGAKVFDHHRSDEELRSSTVQGLVGHFRGVVAEADGLYGELHLLPSSTQIAEALDQSIANQTEGLPPLVGVSHDVAGMFRQVASGGRSVQEAVEIKAVFSTDVVADPSAGGEAMRAVAGGSGDTVPESNQEDTMTIEELLELIDGATPEQRASALEGLGITADDLQKLQAPPAPAVPGQEPDPNATPEPEKVPAGAGAATEAVYARESAVGRMVVREAIEGAKLPAEVVDSITPQLPERFTEGDISRVVETVKRTVESLEAAGLSPKAGVGQVQITQEERDRKSERVEHMLEGNYREGYNSLKQAWVDFTGFRGDILGEDVNAMVLRESFSPSRLEGARESVETGTWAQVFADALNKRMIAEYGLNQLQEWRRLVSSVVPRNDFRDAHINRIGGYGTLPTVGQGGAYQPLATPGDEEVTYSISKKGGTEDLTLEAIANDDLSAVQRIPVKLGRAAAQTLYRGVFNLLSGNPTIYDSTSLFTVGHANTNTGSALAQGTLSTGRKAMRQQTAYGDSEEVLGAVPKTLVVPSALEETAFQLATSAVAITSGKDATAPNIHQGIEPLVVDYFTDENDWFIVADPTMIPTIEVGFYQGREEPELFVQDDPRVGSVFTADKITWKIRHIWGLSVLDYRGFYRGQG